MDSDVGFLERQAQNNSGSGKCQSDSGDAAEGGEHQAFGEHLANLARGRGAERGADGSLEFAVRRAHEHEVGNVGAGNGQDQRGNPHKQVQAGLVFVTQLLNACAAGREMQRLLGDQRRFTGLQLGDGTQEPLLEFDLHVRFDLFGVGMRRDATDDVEPVLLGKIQNAAGAVDERFVGDGDPERGRIFEAVAEKAGRRDANDGERLPVEADAGAYDGAVGAEFLLPGAIAEHGNGSSALAVVVGSDHAPGIGANPEHGEVVSGNVFAFHGLGGLVRAAATHADKVRAGLKRGEFDESLGVVAEGFVLVVGEERPIVLQAAVDAAILDVAHAIEFARLRHRQGVQQHGVDQSEDSGGGADAEREGQDHGRGENG